MEVKIYESRRPDGSICAEAWLTDEHSASSYGQPVLLIDFGDGRQAIGAADLLPSGMSGAAFLRAVLVGDCSNHCDLSTAARKLLVKATHLIV